MTEPGWGSAELCKTQIGTATEAGRAARGAAPGCGRSGPAEAPRGRAVPCCPLQGSAQRCRRQRPSWRAAPAADPCFPRGTSGVCWWTGTSTAVCTQFIFITSAFTNANQHFYSSGRISYSHARSFIPFSETEATMHPNLVSWAVNSHFYSTVKGMFFLVHSSQSCTLAPIHISPQNKKSQPVPLRAQRRPSHHAGTEESVRLCFFLLFMFWRDAKASLDGSTNP